MRRGAYPTSSGQNNISKINSTSSGYGAPIRDSQQRTVLATRKSTSTNKYGNSKVTASYANSGLTSSKLGSSIASTGMSSSYNNNLAKQSASYNYPSKNTNGTMNSSFGGDSRGKSSVGTPSYLNNSSIMNSSKTTKNQGMFPIIFDSCAATRSGISGGNFSDYRGFTVGKNIEKVRKSFTQYF